jgi:hypothetical protein
LSVPVSEAFDSAEVTAAEAVAAEAAADELPDEVGLEHAPSDNTKTSAKITVIAFFI